MNEFTDVVIVGAGPIGLCTALYVGMFDLSCCIVEHLSTIGGQCTMLYPQKPIHDLPGYVAITGSDLIAKLSEQIAQFKPLYYLNNQAVALESDEKYHYITTSDNLTIKTRAVIIAAGPGVFVPNKIKLNIAEKLEGKSLFYSINNVEDLVDKNVVILGGGDSAVDWLLVLYKYAKHVYIVHRRNRFNAMPASIQRMLELSAKNVTIITGFILDSLCECNGILTSVIIKDNYGQLQTINCDRLLAFFGSTQKPGPIANWGLNMSENYVNVNNFCETSIYGIYAVGDIAIYSHKIKLIVTGFAEAATAVHHIYNTLFKSH